ncbi:putative phosphoribosylaminoimidazole-succinocarboxamide synthase [Rosellinia necatrix]|uniref:Phosphoribosylaminoimidazole-succinocarboxamide synthase n=1 Tax=Rosellinia necatrix TaxID=77044 RepID=A0A1W2TF44_ROSNE|nr:putative phosphoribosylaminoimidazole-succinocarboxamide synthase [Rosellinia necatrix]
MTAEIVTSVDLPLPVIARGKVREIYRVTDSTLLLVTSDRISAYDVILENGVQHKGTVLTLITNHWLNTVLPGHVPGLKHHLLSLSIPPQLPLSPQERAQLQGRSMVVNKYRVFPVEAIVRGYITGSSWAEYKESGTVHGLPQPEGLQQCQAFPGGPIYTPSTKAELGEKDMNITPDHARQIVGDKYADKIENLALAIYKAAHAYALERGIIVADTKFEFGLDVETDEVVLVDEVLTPDSSRFWPAKDYAPGRDQKSFDKQYLRDWLTSQGLKGKEGVRMTKDVQDRTSAKYLEAFQLLTGETLGQAMDKLIL